MIEGGLPGGYGARRSRVKALGGNAPLGFYYRKQPQPLTAECRAGRQLQRARGDDA
jgi:hypothetical protein